MNVTNMVQGNLALKLETPAEPTFTVVQGGRSGFQPLTVKPARNQQAVVAPARVALKVPTIVAVAVALTLFFVLAMSVFSARHAAYAESVSNITYETIRVQAWRFSLVACRRISNRRPFHARDFRHDP